MADRTYTFPTHQDLARFMNVLDMYTCWRVEGFYPDSKSENQHGDLIVTQALPHKQVKVPWKVHGCSATFDMTFLEAHVEPFRKERAEEHMLEIARRFGFEGGRAPRSYGGVSVRIR